MAGANTNIFSQTKTINDYTQADAQKWFQQQILLSKLGAAQSGQNLPAPLQLANEYQKRLAAGDNEGANTLYQFAKIGEKGLLPAANGGVALQPGFAPAVSTIAGAKAGAQADARNTSELNFAPQIETAKTQSAAAITGQQAISPLAQIRKINEGTFKGAYMDTASKLARLSPFDSGQEKARQTDLLRQARLDLAAPLAKQLGVNPTDKDFKASLDRIFDLSSDQKSRANQLDALEQRTLGRLRGNPYSNLPKPIDPALEAELRLRKLLK